MAGRVVFGLLGAAWLAQGLALLIGPLALSVADSGSLALLCAGTTWSVRGFLLRPRTLAESLIGGSMVGFVLSYSLRMSLALAHDAMPRCTIYMARPRCSACWASCTA